MEGAEELMAALSKHGEALAEELRLLGDMPQVHLTPGCVFDRATPKGSLANKRGVICRLLCCGGQLDSKCNYQTGEKGRPDFVAATKDLRAKVAKHHGSESCAQKGRQAKAASASGSTAPPGNLFAAIMSAQIARQHASAAGVDAEELGDVVHTCAAGRGSASSRGRRL